MSRADDKSRRIAELAEKIREHRALYYGPGPTISDAAFDALEDELRALAPKHPVLGEVGAPVAVTEWAKARHEMPMGSLNKAVSIEELRAWATRSAELLAADGRDDATLSIAEKLDGISLEVIYDQGRLVDAITRGDGLIGESIAANVRRMKGVPRAIPHAGRISVRGEIILCLSDMREHFPDMVSPRNGAAGTAKRFDGEGSEHLTVLFYDVADHLEAATKTEIYAELIRLGFRTPNYARGTIEDAITLYGEYERERRASLDYEIDGLVIEFDALAAFEALGELNHRPRGAIAFKFPSPAKKSRVVAITWDTGSSGRITPVAIVEPVELASAMVQRASLHNAARVRALGIGVGDDVLVSRRNDVIPYVEEVITHHSDPTPIPTRCAVCGEPIVVVGEYLYCRNLECTALVEGRLHKWIDAIGALEWGDKLVEQVVAAKLAREPVDLYKLKPADLKTLERMGDKGAKKALDELHSRLPLTLPVFLKALGIEALGISSARLLVGAGLDTIEKVLAADEAFIAAIPGLGPIKAAATVAGLASRREEIGRLLAAGIVPMTEAARGPLAGKTFCFTGASSRPRAELTRLVESNGGRALSGVTKDLDYLVIADPASTSSKAVKARKLGTVLITEADLDAMIAGGADAPEE